MSKLHLDIELLTAKLHIFDLEYNVKVLVRWKYLQILRALEFSTWHLILCDDDALLIDGQHCTGLRRRKGIFTIGVGLQLPPTICLPSVNANSGRVMQKFMKLLTLVKEAA